MSEETKKLQKKNTYQNNIAIYQIGNEVCGQKEKA